MASLSLPALIKALWGLIWKYTVEKSQINATNVNRPLLRQTIWGHSFPKYRIQQFDGNSSLCESDQPSEHDDYLNKDQCPLCPNCDQTLTSTFHQCQDSDHTCDQITQEPTTKLKTYTKMGPHTEKCENKRKEWEVFLDAKSSNVQLGFASRKTDCYEYCLDPEWRHWLFHGGAQPYVHYKHYKACWHLNHVP